MKIIDLIKAKQDNLLENKSVTIAFLGDSVTQGCFECYLTSPNSIETVFDSKSAYSQRLKEIINILYSSVQINIINSGISGDSAFGGENRLDRDILSYNPDLCVVSYGLNDSCYVSLEKYKASLSTIFKKLKERHIETIFLTQNAMCSKVSCHLTDDFSKKLATDFSKVQNDGTFKKYIETAKTVCDDNNVTVCDLYSVWEKMIENKVDTTELLSNKLNHPIREYHYYMAIKLLETMFNN